MIMTIENKRRELFEAWSAENSGASLDRDCRGGYLSFSSMQLWAAFNAALDAVVIRMPDEEPGYMYYAPDVHTAIESTGLGLKVLP